jgi:cytosine/adenosine deaminase-related metal-dependent hydrolase
MLDSGTTPSGDASTGGTVTAPGVVTCARTLAAPQTGSACASITAGSGKTVVLRGDVLGPADVYENGEVVYDDSGLITCVGCDCATAPGYATATVVECAGSAISPGFINPHDHITFANNPPMPHGTERYEHRHDWRKGARGHTKITTASGAPGDAVTGHELRMLMSGVTAMAGAGSRYGLVRNLDQTDVRVLEGLGTRESDSDTFPLDDSGGTIRTNCAYGQARTTEAAVVAQPSYVPHIAEGIGLEARNELVCSSESDAANGKFQLLTSHTAVVHAVALRASDAQKFRDTGATVVWSPRSNVDLYGNTAPVTLLDRTGVTLALGTDWVPSGSMNMLREIQCADSLNTRYYGKHFSDYDLWRMATYGGARATRSETVVGALKPGYSADIAIFRGRDGARKHRAAIAAGVEDVALVLRGGTAVYGDTAVLDGVGGVACETMDVCAVSKKACVNRDTGKTASVIKAAIEAFYPLYFCRDTTPTNEPSCTPFRTTYPDGITATDGDGDGVPDATDLCPSVFDPIRPMDGGKQADEDNDGKGDACDPCPLDATDACTRMSSMDRDGDGIRDELDVCPDVADASQADSDQDGRGDACDSCTQANPGAVACLTTIDILADAQNAALPPFGAIVRVENVEVVSLLSNSGYQKGFVGKGTTGQVQVRTGSTTPSVTVGQRVAAVEGVYDNRASTSTDTASLRIRVTRIIP